MRIISAITLGLVASSSAYTSPYPTLARSAAARSTLFRPQASLSIAGKYGMEFPNYLLFVLLYITPVANIRKMISLTYVLLNRRTRPCDGYYGQCK